MDKHMDGRTDGQTDGWIDKPERCEEASKELLWMHPEKTALKNRIGELLLL